MIKSLTMRMMRIAAIIIVLLLLCGCTKKDVSSPEYEEANNLYLEIVADLNLYENYDSPEVDRIINLLNQVPPESSDYDKAQSLLSELEEKREEVRRAKEEKARMQARLSQSNEFSGGRGESGATRGFEKYLGSWKGRKTLEVLNKKGQPVGNGWVDVDFIIDYGDPSLTYATITAFNTTTYLPKESGGAMWLTVNYDGTTLSYERAVEVKGEKQVVIEYKTDWSYATLTVNNKTHTTTGSGKSGETGEIAVFGNELNGELKGLAFPEFLTSSNFRMRGRFTNDRECAGTMTIFNNYGDIEWLAKR